LSRQYADTLLAVNAAYKAIIIARKHTVHGTTVTLDDGLSVLTCFFVRLNNDLRVTQGSSFLPSSSVR